MTSLGNLALIGVLLISHDPDADSGEGKPHTSWVINFVVPGLLPDDGPAALPADALEVV